MNLLATDIYLTHDFYTIEKEKLSYVYTVNKPAGSPGKDTECPKCGAALIKRNGYLADSKGLDEIGNCKNCHEHVAVMS